jgi:hypothetical protein
LKLYPIADLDLSLSFLQAVGLMLRNAQSTKARVAWAELLVQLITPLAATVNTEVNVPACKQFVDDMFQPCMELLKRAKNAPATLPLLVAVLSMAHRDAFMSKWPGLLSTCLATLKHSKPNMQDIVAECVVRLVWVYSVRFSAESNQATEGRMKLIADAFFPSGEWGVQRIVFSRCQVVAACVVPRRSHTTFWGHAGGRSVNPKHLQSKFFTRLLLLMAHAHLDFTMRQVRINF